MSNRERRLGFRVPLSPASGLSTTVWFQDKTYPARPINISMCGIFLEFSFEDIENLPLNDKIEVKFELRAKTIILSGILRRRDRNRYGVFFPDCTRNDEMEPPDIFRHIVSELQRKWLATRIR